MDKTVEFMANLMLIFLAGSTIVIATVVTAFIVGLLVTLVYEEVFKK